MVSILILGVALSNGLQDFVKNSTTVNVKYVNPKIEDVSFYSECDGVISKATANEYKAKAYIKEKDIPNVKENSVVTISGAALGDEVFEGYISWVSDKATNVNVSGYQNTVLECEITIENGNNNIKEGYNITARVTTLKVENAIVADYKTVMSDGKNYWVYLVDNNKAKKQYIEIYKESENGYIVESGINTFDMLVYQPQEDDNLEYRRVNATIKGE